MKPSSANLAAFPDIDRLLIVSRAVAVLDAILEPEWELRYFSFDPEWDSDAAMASMRNGEGDQYMAFFSPRGCLIAGLDHESPMSPFAKQPPQTWPGLLAGVPPELRTFVETEPVPSLGMTFCIWRLRTDSGWRIGNSKRPRRVDPDGSERLLFIMDGRPETYQRWATMYFGAPIPLTTVAEVYAQKPISPAIVAALNPEHPDLDQLKQELRTLQVSEAL